MGEFQRALYDFSVAIRVEDDNKADPKKLGDYYSKLLSLSLMYYQTLLVTSIMPLDSLMKLMIITAKPLNTMVNKETIILIRDLLNQGEIMLTVQSNSTRKPLT